MKKTKTTVMVLLLGTFFFLHGCEEDADSIWEDVQDEETTEEVDTEGSEDTTSDTQSENSGDHEETGDYTWDASDVTTIELNGSSASISGEGATAEASLITISKAGNYVISGTLNDGQIMVETDDSEIVRLILDGASITNTSNSPIAIMDAEKTIVVLAENSDNFLTDATSYVFDNSDDDEPNATLFSKDDLSVYGEGSLTIEANYNDGIASKDGLIIKSGSINITTIDDGIRGKDYLIIKDGNITINAGGDGLKSDNEDDETLGYISVEAGQFNITSDGDGIQAQTDLMISTGSFSITTGGGSSYSYNEDVSAKALKADVSLVIDNGNFTIQSSDDAIHSNKSISINNGTFNMASGDDGIHADSALGIHGGEFQITKSYEGLESSVITIDDGEFFIVSSDDGINVAGGSDSSGMNRPGFGGFSSSSSNYYLYINGGYIAVYADGDGLDANGNIEMTGGTVLVHGPTSDGNGFLDYDGSFVLDGGFLAAAGSAGMVQVPGSTSSQYSVLIGFTSSMSAGEIVHIENEDGETIVNFEPSKRYEAMLFSSADLEKGETYSIFTGGTCSGDKNGGLYTGGTYNEGTHFDDFTVSDIVSLINFR